MDLLDSLLEHAVVVVTGKGGTGKTTVSALLGMAAARRGRRTLLVETQGACRIPDYFEDACPGYDIVPLAPRLFGTSITAERCVEDYIVRQLRFRTLYKMVFRNRVMAPFMDAVPGLPDLVQLGRVWDLLHQPEDPDLPWETIVVDAPATGHGLTMLDAPRAMMEMTVAGPFHANARRVRELFSDPEKTALVFTTLPEELPVNETLDLYRGLEDYRDQLGLCVLNQALPPVFREPAAWDRHRSALHAGATEAGRDALSWAARWHRLVVRQQDAEERLGESLPCPVVSLPRLLHPIGAEDLGELLGDLETRSPGTGPIPLERIGLDRPERT